MLAKKKSDLTYRWPGAVCSDDSSKSVHGIFPCNTMICRKLWPTDC